MNTRFGLALALALGLGMAAPVASVSAQQRLAQGERPRNTDETKAAERALEEAGEAADEATARPFFEQALAAAQAGIADDPKNPLAPLQAGMAALGLKRYKEAGEYFDQAETLRPLYKIDTEPTREQAWIDLYNEAAPLLEPTTYEQAAAILDNANAIYGSRPELFFTVGQLYAALGQYDRALTNYDRAHAVATSPTALTERDSATVAAWLDIADDVPLAKATTLVDAGRRDEAIMIFRDMAAKEPENIQITRDLATLLVQAGRQDEAFQVYEQLLGRPDLTSQDYYAIGVGYYQGSDWSRAGGSFVKAVEMSAKDRDALELAADALQRDSAFAEVIPLAERWAVLDPNSRNAHLTHAQAARGLGQDSVVLELVKKIEAFDLEIEALGLRRQDPGGGRVNGVFVNKKLAPGTRVTVTFTFYDAQGNAIGTQATNVSAGEADVKVDFSVEFVSETPVGGYGYAVQTM